MENTIYGKSDMIGMGTPTEIKEINQKLNELEKAQGNLGEMIGVLETQLIPILSRPQTAINGVETKEQESMCPLATILQVRIYAAGSQTKRVNDILSRLQI